MEKLEQGITHQIGGFTILLTDKGTLKVYATGEGAGKGTDALTIAPISSNLVEISNK